MIFHQKPITFVGQVHLKVKELQRSIAFYEKVMGFKYWNRRILPQALLRMEKLYY